MKNKHSTVLWTLLLAVLVGCSVPMSMSSTQSLNRVSLVFQQTGRTVGVDWANLIKTYSVTLVSQQGFPSITATTAIGSTSLVIDGIATGTWNLEVHASDGVGKVVGEATLVGVALPSATPIAVTVHPTTGGTGSYSFALKFPVAAGVTSVQAQLLKLDNTGASVPTVGAITVSGGTNQVLISGLNVTSGSYRLQLVLKNAAGKAIRYVNEAANIWDNVVLDSWIAPDGTISSGRTLAADDFKSNVAVLEGLAAVVDGVAFPFSFNPASPTLALEVSSSTATQSIVFMATEAVAGQFLEFSKNGSTFTPFASGSPSQAVTLAEGVNTCYIRVTAPDSSKATLTITITKVFQSATGYHEAILPTVMVYGPAATTYAYPTATLTAYSSIVPISSQWMVDTKVVQTNSTAALLPLNLDTTNLTTGVHQVQIALTLSDGTVVSSEPWPLAVRSESSVQRNPVGMVSAGFNFTMVLRPDGTLWTTGSGNWGQSGDGTTVDRTSLVQVASGVASVTTGSEHTLILKADGSLWATGKNQDGQLGDGTMISRTNFVRVAAGVASVAAYMDYTMVVKVDGSLWATGNNASGQFGNGTNVSTTTFVRVLASGVSSVSTGHGHSVILKTDGTVWTTGYGGDGALGIGGTRNAFVQALTGVASISAGDAFTAAVKFDGTLWTTGHNGYGELGDGTNTTRSTFAQVTSGIASVSAGGYQLMAVGIDGGLWATGGDSFGELGDGGSGYRTSFIQVASGVASVSACNYHTVVLKLDGSVWTTGRNNYGQLGDGTTSDRNYFKWLPDPHARPKVFVGGTHNFVIKPDGTLWAAGLAADGRLGNSQTTPNVGTFTQVMSGSTFFSVATGANHTLFLKSDGSVWSVGVSDYGQLGTTTTSVPFQVLGAGSARAIAAGQNFSLVLMADGSLQSAGENAGGQLGLGDNGDRSVFTPVPGLSGIAAIAAGADYSMALASDGTLYTTGIGSANWHGQIGVPGATGWTSRTQFLPVLSTVKSISAGYQFSAALRAGSLWMAGFNSLGQLGLGSTSDASAGYTNVGATGVVASVATGWQHTLVLKTGGTLWGMGLSYAIAEGADRDLPFLIDTDVATMSAGENQTYYEKTDGSLWWVGQDTYDSNGIPSNQGNTSTPVRVW